MSVRNLVRLSVGSLATAVVLFIGIAVGAVGTWALPLSAVALLFTAVMGAIAMEERDLVVTATPSFGPAPPVRVPEEPPLEAV